MRNLRVETRVVYLALVGGLTCFGFIADEASALPSPIKVVPGKISRSVSAGIIAGGQASDEFSLIGIRHEITSSGTERLVLEYGDRSGRPLKGEPGFFQVALDRDSRRIVIDLAQVNRTAVDAKQLTRILEPSKLMAVSDMTMDPHDHSTNITLSTKAPVKLSVAAEANGQGKLTLEISEEPAGAKP